jgi:hypothetical protein
MDKYTSLLVNKKFKNKQNSKRVHTNVRSGVRNRIKIHNQTYHIYHTVAYGHGLLYDHQVEPSVYALRKRRV